MKKNKRVPVLTWSFYAPILVFLIGVFSTSCSTLQSDRMLTMTDDSLETDLTALTLMIVPLDKNPTLENKLKARSLIDELEERKIEDTVFRARLAAWSGRLSIIEGNKKNAEKAYKAASHLVSLNPEVTVLSARLEKNTEIRLEILEKGRNYTDATAIIDIEKGRTLCELGRWSEAVAAFDTAFPHLPGVYRETYTDERENAWNLRSIDTEVTKLTATISTKQAILWKDAIEMVQAETTLLSFITGDAVWPTEKIATALVERKLMPQQDHTTAFLHTNLLRSDAAFFLWHLHSHRQGKPALLTRYSARYKNVQNSLSPIPDIALTDAFFDSVLGCIEWEFMTLPDGKHFRPTDTVKGAMFLSMIQKIETTGRTIF